MNSNTPDIRLPRTVQADADREILERVRESVDASRDRNDLLREYDYQLRGWGIAATRSRWKGACLLEDPLTREHHTALLASLMGTLRQPPFWLVESSDPQDEEEAQQIEGWLNVKAFEYQLLRYLYDAAYNALRDPYAVLYCGWRQEYDTEFLPVCEVTGAPEEGVTGGWEAGRMGGGEDLPSSLHPFVPSSLQQVGQIVAPEERQPGFTYRPKTLLRERTVYEGVEFRVPDAYDVTLDPPNAQDVQTADGIVERMYLSAHDLMDGVDLYGYDAECVREMLRRGPTSQVYDEWRQERDERDGIYPSGRKQAGYWECYQYVGRVPALLDEEGNSRIPERLRGQDFVWMVCPQYDLVFKCVRLPYEMRPYVLFQVLPTPGRLQGESVPSLLKPLQEEATANIRWTVDSMNLSMNPVLLMPKSQFTQLSKFSTYPGAVLPYEPGQGEIKPLVMDKSAFQAGLALQNDLRVRARELISAEGFGQLTPKVRKAAEIDFAQAGVDQKFDLVLSCFQRGMEQLAVLLISLHAQHMDAEGETIRSGLKTARVTPQALRKRYRYVPHANSANSNPQLRLQRWQGIMQAVYQSPLFARWVQSGNLQPAWNLLRRFLEVNDERNVVAIIGAEPTPGPDAKQILMQVMQMAAGLAQHGDPGAGQIAQMIQSALMNQGPAQQAQQASAPTADDALGGPAGGAAMDVAPNPHDVMPIDMDPRGFAAAGYSPAVNGAA